MVYHQSILAIAVFESETYGIHVKIHQHQCDVLSFSLPQRSFAHRLAVFSTFFTTAKFAVRVSFIVPHGSGPLSQLLTTTTVVTLVSFVNCSDQPNLMLL